MDFRKILLFTILFLGSINFLWAASSLLPYSYDIDYTEGFILRDSENLMEGDLYAEPSLENNFQAEKYPPALYTIVAGISTFTGLSYVAGRLISLISIFSTSLLIYLIIKKKTRQKTPIPSLMAFSSFLSIYSGLLLRVDMLGVMFSVLSLYFVVQKKYFKSLVPAVLAVFTKQIFISVFLATLTHLLYKKDFSTDINLIKKFKIEKVIQRREKFFKYVSIYIAIVLSLTLILELFTGGFIENIVLANLGGWDIQWELIKWASFTFMPLIGASIYYIYIFRDKLFGAFFLFSTFIGFIQFTRGGAFVNAMLEPFIASLICLGLLYVRIPQFKSELNILIILQALLFITAPIVEGNLYNVTEYSQSVKVGDYRIMNSIEGQSNVFTENPGFAWKETSVFPPETWSYVEMYKEDKLSKQDLLKVFRKENYSIIVSQNRLKKLPLDSYLSNNYRHIETLKRKNLNLAELEWKIYKRK